ncbi:hypothetical protein [Actinomadura madurae]|nr:hypothetical protein [Actinomadura madurae]
MSPCRTQRLISSPSRWLSESATTCCFASEPPPIRAFIEAD